MEYIISEDKIVKAMETEFTVSREVTGKDINGKDVTVTIVEPIYAQAEAPIEKYNYMVNMKADLDQAEIEMNGAIARYNAIKAKYDQSVIDIGSPDDLKPPEPEPEPPPVEEPI